MLLQRDDNPVSLFFSSLMIPLSFNHMDKASMNRYKSLRRLSTPFCRMYPQMRERYLKQYALNWSERSFCKARASATRSCTNELLVSSSRLHELKTSRTAFDRIQIKQRSFSGSNVRVESSSVLERCTPPVFSPFNLLYNSLIIVTEDVP